MKYGLIGEKLKHSYSKDIHNFLGNNEYSLVEIPKTEIDMFMELKKFKGINVTIPYKETVMKYCNLSSQAEKIGAVNTIVNRSGCLYGYNTDYFGFLTMVRKNNIVFDDVKVLILGSGGTSKTVSVVAIDEGARQVTVIARQNTVNVKNDRIKFDTYNNIDMYYDYDIIINTTPVGMYPNNGEVPISKKDISEFKNLKAAIDVIYNPMRTMFLNMVSSRGIPVYGGLYMLIAQAFYAHKLFFDENFVEKIGNYNIFHAHTFPFEESEEMALNNAVLEFENKFCNFVLIGMPGSGKTTIGKLLSKKLKLKFVDVDEEIKKSTGKLPSKIIKENGESEFRRIESIIVENLSKKNSCVIATGGGSVLDKQNRDALKQNGVVIFLDREIEKLDKKDRPLSLEIEKLHNVRFPIYKEFADYEIKVDGEKNEVVDNIIRKIKR